MTIIGCSSEAMVSSSITGDNVPSRMKLETDTQAKIGWADHYNTRLHPCVCCESSMSHYSIMVQGSGFGDRVLHTTFIEELIVCDQVVLKKNLSLPSCLHSDVDFSYGEVVIQDYQFRF